MDGSTIRSAIAAAHQEFAGLKDGKNADYIPALAEVLQQLESGEQVVEDNIGVDATGQVFNSIVAIEQYKGHQQNPFVNAGAITTTGLVGGSDGDEKWAKILRRHSLFAGRDLTAIEQIAKRIGGNPYSVGPQK